jgi:hypothetical protein
VRRLTLRDLPFVLDRLQAPVQVRRALGAYNPQTDPEIGLLPHQNQYSEDVIFAGNAADINQAMLAQIPSDSLAVVQSSPPDAPGFGEINWTCINYNANVQLTDNPNRVVLIVENTGTGTVAVNFGSGASVAGIGAGLQLYNQGSVLYADEKCPTNSIYIAVAAGGSYAVVQGTRGAPLQPGPQFIPTAQEYG